MDIRVEGDIVSLEMTRIEAARLGFALRAGYEATSRPEYYIRTGLSQPVLRSIARVLIDPDVATPIATIELEAGVEEIENPRRPRPPRGPDAL